MKFSLNKVAQAEGQFLKSVTCIDTEDRLEGSFLRLFELSSKGSLVNTNLYLILEKLIQG